MEMKVLCIFIILLKKMVNNAKLATLNNFNAGL